MRQILNYNKFLLSLLIKKKNTYIMPLFVLLICIIAATVISFVRTNNDSLIYIYAFAFLQISTTIVFSGLKSINIYRELEEEGIDILVFSKPISRTKILLSKQIAFFAIGVLWSLVLTITNAISFAILQVNSLIVLSLISLGVMLLTYVIFGNITALFALKFNQKLAITLPLVLAAPLMIGGSVINSNTTNTASKFASYLNLPYQFNKSKTASNTNEFYFKNNKDQYFIVPNGYENKEFSVKQKQFLDKAYDLSKNSAQSIQVYSWLSTPYQFLDVFNLENKDVLASLTNKTDTNLNNYIYYNGLDSKLYDYQLDKNAQNLLSNFVKFNNQTIVPGLLKINSEYPDLINTKLIYAREGADKFDVNFPEDEFVYASPNNIVGELSWKFTKELLESAEFMRVSDQFINKFIAQYITNKRLGLAELKQNFLSELSKDLNADKTSVLANISDLKVTVLDPNAIKNKIIKSETEKKLYLTVALMYYVYFRYQDSRLLGAILFNETKKDRSPSQLTIFLDNFNYNIGGFSSFAAKQQVIDNKVAIRYELQASDNYLFQTTDNIYALVRANQIVNKNVYWIIWLILASTLASTTTFLYRRKDYK
ncbi:hypothetical protein ACJA23_01180 [Mycoplasma corogypsi]|uniref:hypothetical protein n=1 Tax=Mycoplasma corogypsi TaxID=2106 RepID=UPI0038738640